MKSAELAVPGCSSLRVERWTRRKPNIDAIKGILWMRALPVCPLALCLGDRRDLDGITAAPGHLLDASDGLSPPFLVGTERSLAWGVEGDRRPNRSFPGQILLAAKLSVA